MLDRFKHHLYNSCQFQKGQRILVANSGGVDSMVLTDLLIRLETPIALAHCNFQLRGAESDADQLFVKEFAARHRLPAYTTNVNGREEAAKRKTSIQTAARDFRYEWFEQLRNDHALDLIATAHHLNDSLETALFNWIRGTGIRGLTGIDNRSGKLLRPMLFASRQEMLDYASSRSINFREDSSNESLKYSRNLIRHQLIPVMKELNPSFDKSHLRQLKIMKDSEWVFDHGIRQLKKKLLDRKGDELFLSVPALKTIPAAKTVLFELIGEFGFNADQCADILATADGQPGKIFLSDNYRLIRDRQQLILAPKHSRNISHLLIEEGTRKVDFNGHRLRIDIIEDKVKAKKTSANIAYLDAAEVSFPLELRTWKPGDYFYPFGMTKKNSKKVGKKKVKDFLTDLKFSIPEKEKVWVVVSADKRVMWVVGQRIDDRFKLRPATRRVLKMKLLPK